jgi:ATP phosphoribosyltransferase
MNEARDRLRIAVQKSGRLSESSLDLLRRAGLAFRASRDKLFLYGENMPVDVLLVRDDDIPGLLVEGSCELGIVGRNVLDEQRLASAGASAPTALLDLGFGHCRLALAVPDGGAITSIADLGSLRIATSYPALLGDWLRAQGIDAEVVLLNGSVEIAPRLGLADAICDLVSSGSTLEANKLRAVETIFKSTATLIRNVRPLNAEKAHALEIVLRRLDGVQKAAGTKYIMLHAPKANLAEIRKLLPGSENPTILPLANDESKVALHAVCSEDVFWETMDALKKAGASSILVLPIEKMML